MPSIGSVSIDLSLNRAQFDRDLKALNNLKVSPLVVRTTIDSKGLALQVKQVSDRLQVKIPVSFAIDQAQLRRQSTELRSQLKREFAQSDFKIGVTVDTRAIAKLNQQLELTRKRFTDLSSTLNSTTLKLNVDDAGFDAAGEKAKKTKQQYQALQKEVGQAGKLAKAQSLSVVKFDFKLPDFGKVLNPITSVLKQVNNLALAPFRGIEIVAKSILNPIRDIFGSIEKLSRKIDTVQTKTAKQFKLTAVVDDTSLTKLNEHLDLKKRHLDSLNRHFESSALTPQINLVNLQELSARLDGIYRQYQRLNQAQPLAITGRAAQRTEEQPVQQTVDLQVDTSGIEKAIAGALPKPGAFDGLGKIITAPFRAVGGVLESVLTGTLEGIGTPVGREIGEGIKDGIEREVGDLAGSFGFLGRELAGALTKELVDALGDDADKIRQASEQIFGKKDLVNESAAVRQRQSEKRSDVRSRAGQQIGKELDFAQQNIEEIRQKGTQAKAARSELVEKAKKLEIQIREDAEKLGIKSFEEQLDRLAQQRDEIIGKLQAASEAVSAEKISIADKDIVGNFNQKIQALQSELNEVFVDSGGGQTNESKAQLQALEKQIAQIESEKEKYLSESLITPIQKRVQDLTRNIGIYQQQAIKNAADPKKVERFNELIKKAQASLQGARSEQAAASPQAVKQYVQSLERLGESYSSVQSTIKDINQTASSQYSGLIDLIKAKDEEISKLERSATKLASPFENIDLVDVPDEVQTKNRTTNKARIKGSPEAQNISSFYKKVFDEVASRSGVVPDASQIPRLVAANLPKGVNAAYIPESNEVQVPPAVLDAINKGAVNNKQLETLIHEIRHAFQSGFGELAGVEQSAIDLIKPTFDESRQFGRKIERSVEGGGQGESADFVRSLEADAYTFAARNTPEIAANLGRDQAVSKLQNKVGAGGGKVENELANLQLKAFSKLSQIAQKTSVDVSEELQATIARIEGSSQIIEPAIEKLADVEFLPVDEIEAVQAEIEQALKQAIAEVIAATGDFAQEVEQKPAQVQRQITEFLGQFNRKKTLVPLAQEFGVENVDQLNKKDLINQLVGGSDLKALQPRVFELTRGKAQQQAARQEKIASVAQTAGNAARVATDAGRGLVSAAQPIANAAKGTVNALGVAAKAGYGLASAVEGLALDIIPLGRSIKGVTKQLVLPAVAFGAATHFLPGGSALAGAATDLAGGAIAPFTQGAAGAASGAASQFISHAVPNIFGIQAQVTTAVTGAIEAVTSVATSAAAQAGAAVIGGKALTAVTGRAVQGAGSVAAKALAPSGTKALPPAQPIALPEAKPKPLNIPLNLPAANKGDLVTVEPRREAIAKTKSASEAARQVGAQAGKTFKAASDKSQEIASKTQQTGKAIADIGQQTFNVIRRIDPNEALESAKNIATSFNSTYKDLKKTLDAQGKAIKKGDFSSAQKLGEQARQLGKEVLDLTAKAQQDIGDLTKSLGSDAAMGTSLGSKLSNKQAQVSRVRNEVTRMQKLGKLEDTSGVIDVSATGSGGTPLYAFEDVKEAIARLKEQAIAAAKAKLSDEDFLTDLAVNAAGFAGSQIGGQFGVGGELAGDLTGALAARQAITVGKAGVSAYGNLKDSDAFKAAAPLQKFSQLVQEINKQLQSEVLQGQLGRELTGDLAGFSIGNLVAQLAPTLLKGSGIPGADLLASVPGKGAIAASALVPSVVQARDRFQSTAQAQPEALYAFGDIKEELQVMARQLLGAAKQPVANPRNLEEFSDEVETQQAIARSSSPGITSVVGLPVEAQDAEEKAARALASAERNLGKFEKAQSQINNRLQKSSAAVNESLEGIGKGKESIFDRLGISFDKLGGKAFGLVKGFLAFQAFNLVQNVLAGFSKQSLDAALSLDRLKTALNFASGGAAVGAQNLEFVRKTVDDLKIPLGAAQEGFAKLAGATRGTKVEGQGTQDVFLGISQAATVLGLTSEQTDRAFTALAQSASKGKVQAEELRGQLAESGLAGAFGIAARSMGVTEAELNKMLETGQVLSEEFLPKFGKQLQAEFGGAAVNASKDAGSAVFDFNNSIQKLQENFGKKLQPIQVAGLQAATAGLKILGDRGDELAQVLALVGTVIATRVAVNLAQLGIAAIQAGLAARLASASFSGLALSAAKAFAGFAVQIAIAAAAAETFKTIASNFVPNDLGKQFGDFASQAESGLLRIEDAARKARGEVSKIGAAPSNLKAEGFDLTLGLGGLVGAGPIKTDSLITAFRDNVPGAKQLKGAVEGVTGGRFSPFTTVAEKRFNDNIIQAGEFASAAQNTAGRAFDSAGIKAQLKQVEAADQRIKDLQRQRGRLAQAPNADKNAIADIDKQIAVAQKERETAAAPALEIQNQVTANLQNAKASLASIDALGLPADKAKELKAQIEPTVVLLEKADRNLKKLQQSSKVAIDPVRELASTFLKVQTALEEASRASEKAFQIKSLGINQKQLAGFSTDVAASRNATVDRAKAERDRLSSELSAEQVAFNERSSALARPGAQEALGEISIDGKPITVNSSVAEIDAAKKTLGDKDGRKKQVLDDLKVFKESEGKLRDAQIQSSQAELNVRQATEQATLQTLDETSRKRESAIQQSTNRELAAVKSLATNRKLSEEDAAITTARIQEDLTGRQIDESKRQLTALEQARNAGQISAEQYAQRQLELGDKISGLEVQQQENASAKIEAVRRKRLSVLEQDNRKAEANIALSQTVETTTVRAGLVNGDLTQEDAAVAQSDIQNETTRKRIDRIKIELAQTKALRADGTLSAKEATDKEIQLNQQLAEANAQLIDTQIQKQEQLRAAIARTFQVRREQLKLEQTESQIQLQSGALAVARSGPVDRGALDLATKSQDLNLRSEAIANEISLLQEELTAVDALGQADQGSADKRRQLAQAIADARLEQINIERDADQTAREQIILGIERQIAAQKRASEEAIAGAEAQKNANDALLQSLEATSKLLESRNNLSKSFGELGLAQSEAQLKRGDRALSLRQRLNDKDLNPNVRGEVVRQLRGQGFSATDSEAKILENRQRIEDDIASKRLAALQLEQEFQRQSLEIDLQRQRIAAENLVIEAEIAQLRSQSAQEEAKSNLEIARASGDTEKIAEAESRLKLTTREVELSDRRLGNAQQSLGIQSELEANSRAALGAQQQTQNVNFNSEQEGRESDRDLAAAEALAKLPGGRRTYRGTRASTTRRRTFAGGGAMVRADVAPITAPTVPALPTNTAIPTTPGAPVVPSPTPGLADRESAIASSVVAMNLEVTRRLDTMINQLGAIAERPTIGQFNYTPKTGDTPGTVVADVARANTRSAGL